MKYNTRLQRNLSFRKIVKHKNKTRKTNTNKRLKHKNKRHTIRFVKKQEKYKKNTRKILYGGFDEYAPIGWMIICILAGFFAISNAIYCIGSQDHSRCDHVDYVAFLKVPEETLRLASMVFPQTGGGGYNFMYKIYDLLKKNKEKSMIFLVFMLFKKLKKLESQHILRLFKENEHYANIISEEYMIKLIEAAKNAKYDDFKRIIREAVEQSPSKGNLDADQHNFLNSVKLLSTAIIQKNEKPTKLLGKLGNYILHGKSNNVLSRIFSGIKSKVSFSSIDQLKVMRSLANGNTKILDPVVASTSIQDEETKGENIEGKEIEEEELKGLGELIKANRNAEQNFLMEQLVFLDPDSINPEIHDNLNEQLVKNKKEIDLIISKAVEEAIDNAVKKTTGNMPTTSSNPNPNVE
jgi:hypothetical protein